MGIHHTAIIGDFVKIGANVSIGAYAVVGDGVEIGDNTSIESHACIRRGSRIGSNCKIGSFAVISGEPQDLHFDSSIESYVEIGDGTTVREGAQSIGLQCRNPPQRSEKIVWLWPLPI